MNNMSINTLESILIIERVDDLGVAIDTLDDDVASELLDELDQVTKEAVDSGYIRPMIKNDNTDYSREFDILMDNYSELSKEIDPDNIIDIFIQESATLIKKVRRKKRVDPKRSRMAKERYRKNKAKYKKAFKKWRNSPKGKSFYKKLGRFNAKRH